MFRSFVIAALMFVLSSCGASQPTSANTHMMTGTVIVPDGQHVGAQNAATLEDCKVSSGYSDVPNANATVKDANGKVLGSTRLVWDKTQTPSEGGCRFRFTFENLPDSDFYTVDLGRRGTQTFSRSDLEKVDWKTSLKLG